MLPFSDADTHHRSFPVVNVSLIGISALVFLYELAISGFGVIGGGDSEALTEFFFTWGFIPEELTRGEPFSSLLSGFGRINIETPTPTWTTIFSSLFMLCASDCGVGGCSEGCGIAMLAKCATQHRTGGVMTLCPGTCSMAQGTRWCGFRTLSTKINIF